MNKPEVILIFHLGSLGDTAVAIPCYREIARRHPGATRYLLTNAPLGAKFVPMGMLIQPMGLTHGSISFPMHLRRLSDMWALRRQIVRIRPTMLYYLTPEKRLLALVRHLCFFLACGIISIKGMPWSRDLQNPRELAPGTLWETEGSRLLRVIGAKTDHQPPADAERSLDLSDPEHYTAAAKLASAPGMGKFIVVSTGGKFPIKDWGDVNWSLLLRLIGQRNPDLGLVLVGSSEERERGDALLQHWAGPSLNACGIFSPRESAAAISRAHLFLGHDTATLHLAAATQTPVIGIYCARDLPGKWFTGRAGDVFFFHKPPCFNCLIVEDWECPNKRICMTEHDPLKILEAVEKGLRTPGRIAEASPNDSERRLHRQSAPAV